MPIDIIYVYLYPFDFQCFLYNALAKEGEWEMKRKIHAGRLLTAPPHFTYSLSSETGHGINKFYSLLDCCMPWPSPQVTGKLVNAERWSTRKTGQCGKVVNAERWSTENWSTGKKRKNAKF
jgi:hypothetical protein